MSTETTMIDAEHVYVWPSVYKQTSKAGAVGYVVKWRVHGKAKSRSKPTKAEASKLRKDLEAAKSKRERWDPATGLPESMLPNSEAVTVYDLAIEVVRSKRESKDWSGGNYRARVETLAQLCTVLVNEQAKGRPDAQVARRALFDYGLPTKPLPLTRKKVGSRMVSKEEQVKALAWVQANSLPVRLLDATKVEEALRAVSTMRATGRTNPFGVDFQQKQRDSLSLICKLAIKQGLLTMNPVRNLDFKIKYVSKALEKTTVPTPAEARALIDEVCEISDNARWQYRAYLTLLLTSGCRPSEATGLRLNDDLYLPETGPGWIVFRASLTTPGARWTDDGDPTEQREQLKARQRGETRKAVIPEDGVQELRRHIEEHGTKRGQLIFVNSHDASIDPSSLAKVWRKARATALDGKFRYDVAEGEKGDGLTVYELRHTYCTMAIDAGVPLARIAAQVGNSPSTLMRRYARWTEQDDAHFIAAITGAMGKKEPANA